jgi:5-methylcytosine-specific restriction enzyme subunit McrC
MNKLFERVVTRRLSRLLRSRGIVVYEQFATTLDVDDAVAIIPDIVIRNPLGRTIVADTKYKKAVESANQDLYQMVAYCRALGATDAVLIDVAEGEPRQLLVRDNVIAIHTLHVDLRTPETLTTSIAEVAARLQQLVSPSDGLAEGERLRSKANR